MKVLKNLNLNQSKRYSNHNKRSCLIHHLKISSLIKNGLSTNISNDQPRKGSLSIYSIKR